MINANDLRQIQSLIYPARNNHLKELLLEAIANDCYSIKGRYVVDKEPPDKWCFTLEELQLLEQFGYNVKYFDDYYAIVFWRK